MIEFTFYDNEGTGVNVRHDQITQFGGVTCDSAFRVKNSISKFIRLLPYVVPHPQALAVTRKTAYEVADPGLPTEFSCSREIAAFLTPEKGVKRVFVTYNGIKYDDELLRTMLYRNLENPYFNSGKDAVKIDLLSVVQIVAALAPSALVIPLTDEGKPTYRLERICPANGIEIEAHDAYHDAVATMKLFMLVQQKAPWAIEIAMECGSATGIAATLGDAMASGTPLFRFTNFGKPDFSPISIVATDGNRKFLGIDLRKEVIPNTGCDIAEQLYKADTPFQIVTSNRFPLLLSVEQMRELADYACPESLLLKSREINSKPEIRSACEDAMSLNTIDRPADPTSEELIYGGFVASGDRYRMNAFKKASTWTERSQIRFEDPRLRDFSARIVLEAVQAGEAVLPANVVSGLAADCATALCRPFSSASARYTTIASCLEAGADDEWIEWARGHFGDHPVFSATPIAVSAPIAAGQISFAF